MQVVRTVHDKTWILSQREREQMELGKRIDRIIASSEPSDVDNTSCGGRGVCPTLGKGIARFLGLGSKRPAPTAALQSVRLEGVVAASTTASSASPASSSSSRIFGVAIKQKTVAGKIAAATQALQSRVQTLEERAETHRQAAKKLYGAKKVDAATREMKKMKQCERQAAHQRSILDAMEAQSDMLEQTEIQKQVAAALGATAKTMKKDKKMLSRAEDAVDSAAELKDMHDDIGQVMQGLGDGNNDFDDDALLSELESMVQEDDVPPHGPGVHELQSGIDPQEALRTEAMAKATESLEKKHRDLEAAAEVHARMPKAPNGKRKEEKQSLLSGP